MVERARIRKLRGYSAAAALAVLSTGCVEFLDSMVQGQMDQCEVNRSARDYEKHGQDEKTARQNAEFDFILKHDRFPLAPRDQAKQTPKSIGESIGALVKALGSGKHWGHLSGRA